MTTDAWRHRCDLIGDGPNAFRNFWPTSRASSREISRCVGQPRGARPPEVDRARRPTIRASCSVAPAGSANPRRGRAGPRTSRRCLGPSGIPCGPPCFPRPAFLPSSPRPPPGWRKSSMSIEDASETFGFFVTSPSCIAMESNRYISETSIRQPNALRRSPPVLPHATAE